jgi:hypothetical protein
MAIGETANKWALYIVGFLILGVLGTALIPLATTQFASNGGFYNSTCTGNLTKVDYPADNTTIFNCVSNSYSAFSGAVPTILVIVFIVSLIVLAVSLLKYGKHR